MTEFKMAYITCSSEDEAYIIGRKLVEMKLAACVNIIPKITSIYEWEGKLCEDSEALLLAKTTASNMNSVIDEVKKLHSYDTPCIVFYDAAGGSDEYLGWVENMINC